MGVKPKHEIGLKWIIGWSCTTSFVPPTPLPPCLWYAICMSTKLAGYLRERQDMTTVEQRIKSLEEAEVMWSRRWGNAMNECSLKQAESQIRIIQRRLAELKGKA